MADDCTDVSNGEPAASMVDTSKETLQDTESIPGDSIKVAKTVEITTPASTANTPTEVRARASNQPIVNYQLERRASETEKSQFKCEFCDKSFRSRDGLRRHRGVFHGKGKYHECPECHKRCATPRELVRHQEGVHSKLKPFECDVCGRHFSESCTVKFHKITVHDRRERPRNQICDKCGKSFFQRNHLNDHIASVHGTDRPHPCSFCNKRFKTRRDARSHQNLVHKRQKKHKCVYCKKLFKTPYEARRHAYQVHERERKRRCQVCKRLFNKELLLKKHMAIVHGVGRCYRCDDCGIRFLTERAHKHHRLVVHERDKPFPCLLCGKRFAHIWNVRVHRTTVHETMKPFRCGECNERFAMKTVLVEHVRRVHLKERLGCDSEVSALVDLLKNYKSELQNASGCREVKPRPFECSICFLTFTGRAQLSLHRITAHDRNRQTTSGKKRYECTKCRCKFTRSDAVRRHIDSVHPGMKLVISKLPVSQNNSRKQSAGRLRQRKNAKRIGTIEKQKKYYLRSGPTRSKSKRLVVQTVHTRTIRLRTHGQRKRRVEDIATRLAEKASL